VVLNTGQVIQHGHARKLLRDLKDTDQTEKKQLNLTPSGEIAPAEQNLNGLDLGETLLLFDKRTGLIDHRSSYLMGLRVELMIGPAAHGANRYAHF